MADVSDTQGLLPTTEMDARVRRLTWERERIAAGTAQLDRGECHDWPLVKAWIEAHEHHPDAELPAAATLKAAGLHRNTRATAA